MLRTLGVSRVAIAILLAPLTLASALLAPVFMIGPVWGAVLGVRLWKGAPGAIAQLRRTHVVFLAIDALMIWYGTWMLRAAEESAKRGGGLLGGLGLFPIAIGGFLAIFSVIVLLLTWRR
jgi:hypothetical protein